MQYFQKKAVVMVQEFQAFWKQSKFQPKTYIHKKRAWMKIAHICNSKNDKKYIIIILNCPFATSILFNPF